MKKQKTILTAIFLLLFILFANFPVFASNTTGSLQKIEYSEEFKEWLELSDEEKEKVLQPRAYELVDTKFESRNPFYLVRNLLASSSTRYSLKDVIPNNIVVKNQQETNSCWAFAALASLETNLALLDYKNGATPKVYDYSERHLEYSTSRIFLNNEENEIGYNRQVGSGGNWYFASSYFTNGTGAVNEDEMKFENNEDIIELSQIQDKTITSQVYDTRDFVLSNISDYKSAIKEHIQNYGAVYAGIYGASLFGDCYNNDTGAIYCDNSDDYPINHAVVIIGWDDNYSVENFNEGLRPSSNGAWIVKNSWGEQIECDLQELKEEIFQIYEQECKNQGWNAATDIPNELVELMGYTIENDKAYIKIGDNGLMYVSYEDANIYNSLYGIIKATDTIDYENIYQYDTYTAVEAIESSNSQIMICNVFEKQTTGSEYLTQVGLYVPETYTCRVYVNPNGTSKAKEDMQLVPLKEGESETFDVGYHTIEFSKPIEIKANNFVVVIEIQGTRTSGVYVSLESKVNGLSVYDVVEVENEKCFIAFGNDLENCEWTDLGKLTQINSSLIDGDSTIKAFTVSNVEDNSLQSIEITTPPTKTKYIEGENFDKSGMVVTANYNNGESLIITDYNISGGTNLQINQTSVTISYEDKTVIQEITVEKAYTEEPKDEDADSPESLEPPENTEPPESLEPPENTEPPGATEPPIIEELNPKNSNFVNAYCEVVGIQFYSNSASMESTSILEIIVNNVIKSTVNDSYEYYYYLSSNQDEENIQDWVKITESQTASDKLEFEINSNDIKNYAELLNSNNLYLYIKEVAIKGGNQSVIISNPMKIEYTIETNVSNADENNLGSSDVINKNNEKTDEDNTTAPGKIPQTGMYVIIVLFIIIIAAIIGTASYKKYSNYKYIK